MKFAMFYEIPVAKPWGKGDELQAYRDTIGQVKLGDRLGFHSFWTVEHHFLEEYSHCSNPEILYGHISAVTENITVFGDKDEIHQIVMNLLTNALDALFDGGGGHRGSVEITFRETGDQVLFVVRDDGRGIAEDKIERVFEPFYTTKGSLGTGLGLPVVRDIARTLGGEVKLESALGTGTTVTVTLPRFRS